MADQYPIDPAILSKITTAKQHKESGDEAFKQANFKAALQSWHFSLMFLEGLDKNAMKSMGMATTPVRGEGDDDQKEKEKTEVDEILEKIYSNQSACHLKLGNWDRAIQSADKALSKNSKNYKALFRKAKAMGELGFFDKCVRVFEDCRKLNPEDSAAVDVELERLRVLDQKREKASHKKMKGFLAKEWSSTPSSKGKGKEKEKQEAEAEVNDSVSEPESAKIEEIS